MTRWSEVPYYPMKDNRKTLKGAAKGVSQKGTGRWEKRCSMCMRVKRVAEFTPGRGLKGRRSRCHDCENEYRRERRKAGLEAKRPADPKIDGYIVLHDPTGRYSGLFRGFDFKATLRVGYWPDGLVVEHHGKLYVVKGVKLHEADQGVAKTCEAARARWARHRDLQDERPEIAQTDGDVCLLEYSVRGRIRVPDLRIVGIA